MHHLSCERRRWGREAPTLQPGCGPTSISRRVQFGLQFTTGRHGSGRTGQQRRSSLNQSEQPHPELQMRLGSSAVQVSADCCQYCCHDGRQCLTRMDNCGISTQLTDHHGRSWTVCPLLRVCEKVGVRVPPSALTFSQADTLITSRPDRPYRHLTAFWPHRRLDRLDQTSRPPR
jgi:hypothetical protein